MPAHNGILPREGLCADVILKLIRRTALNPALLLPLVLLARLTKKGQDLSILHPTAARRLRILLYYALARRASAWLSDRVRNNWSDDRYDWSREIVLVTGGAAGIGGSMVRFFEEKGVKVVVLDIQPMSFTTCGFIPVRSSCREPWGTPLTHHSIQGPPLPLRHQVARERQRRSGHHQGRGRPPDRHHQQRRRGPGQDAAGL